MEHYLGTCPPWWLSVLAGVGIGEILWKLSCSARFLWRTFHDGARFPTGEE